MAVAALKNARLDMKTTQKNKELLALAADLRGVDLTTFVIELALKEARELVKHSDELVLKRKEQQALFSALSNTNKPTESLKELLSSGTFSER